MKQENSFISQEKFKKQKNWGLLASIDLYDCDPFLIRSHDEIRNFVVKLCKEIDMVRHGDVYIDRFGGGELEGNSFMQFIETSSITCHFDEPENRAFLDVFSCKYFDPVKTAEFCKEFLKASNYKINILTRK